MCFSAFPKHTILDKAYVCVTHSELIPGPPKTQDHLKLLQIPSVCLPRDVVVGSRQQEVETFSCSHAGVSNSSKGYEASDKYVPSSVLPIATHTSDKLAFSSSSNEKPRKKLYLMGVGLLGIVGLAIIAFTWNSSPKAAPRLTAMGEGEYREDFVTVKGTQASCCSFHLCRKLLSIPCSGGSKILI